MRMRPNFLTRMFTSEPCSPYLGAILTERGYKYITRHIVECFGRDITLSECTTVNLDKFKTFLLGRVAKNSARMYLATVKSTLNLYKEENDIPCKDLSILNSKLESTISVFLNVKELKQLEKNMWRFEGRDRMYLLCFLCSAWCGARVSDMQGIDTTNIVDGKISYVCQKTGRIAEVPVKVGLPKWLDELRELQKTYDFCDRTYNLKIKEICMRSGINEMCKAFRGGKELRKPKWALVSTHTARRSFATNLYLEYVDVYTISRMMGHTSVDMTQKYICSGIRDLDNAMTNFFGRYKSR